ncbi:hypothetical protein AGMMS49983_06450 [Clostridia bacterium]|nr:hypothetical protein AGMMS49983_06450 [Clostridia bacterium]
MDAKVRHMVVFNLKPDADAKVFLETARAKLGPIPYATNILQCYQTNAMCPFKYGFSFDFASQEDYERYNSNPDHVWFVTNFWKTQVADFMEVDFEEL